MFLHTSLHSVSPPSHQLFQSTGHAHHLVVFPKCNKKSQLPSMLPVSTAPQDHTLVLPPPSALLFLKGWTQFLRQALLMQPSVLLWLWGSKGETLGANTNTQTSQPPTAADKLLMQTFKTELYTKVHCSLSHLFSLLRVPLPCHHFFFYWNSDKHWSIWITLSMRFLHYFYSGLQGK